MGVTNHFLTGMILQANTRGFEAKKWGKFHMLKSLHGRTRSGMKGISPQKKWCNILEKKSKTHSIWNQGDKPYLLAILFWEEL